MIKNFKTYEVRWYKGGKLEPDDSSHVEYREDTVFKVGDFVDSEKNTILYWYDNFDGNINNIGIKGHWNKIEDSIMSGKVAEIDEVKNVDDYTGQIIKVHGYWPWFQTKNIIKKIR